MWQYWNHVFCMCTDSQPWCILLYKKHAAFNLGLHEPSMTERKFVSVILSEFGLKWWRNRWVGVSITPALMQRLKNLDDMAKCCSQYRYHIWNVFSSTQFFFAQSPPFFVHFSKSKMKKQSMLDYVNLRLTLQRLVHIYHLIHIHSHGALYSELTFRAWEFKLL